jgi:MarR family transcriptional regulator, lower aerobic nicotinate degradation pathway regulator
MAVMDHLYHKRLCPQCKLLHVLDSERPPEELGRFTGFLMNYVGTRSGRRFTAALESHGMHPRHFGVMTVLDARPGMTQQELADHAGVDRSSMVALMDELESRGIAERRPHPEDRRKRCIHLTARGRRKLEELRAVAKEVGEESFGALSADERATLHHLLRKLAGYES